LSVDDTITEIRKVQSGKEIKADRKRKLQDINDGQNNPMSVTSIKKRTGWETEIIRDYLKEHATFGFRGRKHKPESLAKLAVQRAKQCKMVTKPEMAIWGMLYGLSINFKYQEPIDRYVVDFLCGKTVIEVFGDYWHNRKDRITVDDEKFIRLRDLGYSVLVFWESDIWLQPQSVIEKLRELR
jgi:very-short-patch-repair endonuclease